VAAALYSAVPSRFRSPGLQGAALGGKPPADDREKGVRERTGACHLQGRSKLARAVDRGHQDLEPEKINGTEGDGTCAIDLNGDNLDVSLNRMPRRAHGLAREGARRRRDHTVQRKRGQVADGQFIGPRGGPLRGVNANFNVHVAVVGLSLLAKPSTTSETW